MNIKLIAVDIDGTLVNKEKEITPITKKAIFDFMKDKGNFVIASGRPIKGIKRYVEELNLTEYNSYLISYNGSLIYDVKNGKPILERYITRDKAHEVIKAADKLGVAVTTYKGDTAYTQYARDKYFKLETSINRLKVEYVDDLIAAVTFDVPKLLITGEPEILEKAEIKLKDMIKDVNIFRSEPFFLEIVPNDVNKGSSLELLCNYLNIPIESSMACGDGYNDISLVESAGLGIAMKNAQKPVLECADYVTDSNNEDGVGKVIYKYALKNQVSI